MAWQEVFPLNVSYRDAEEERELRLASQARAGAEWALSALVARYQPPVTRYLTRLTGDPETSRALAERIFVRMEKRLRGPHGGQHLRLWLLRACTEAGLDTLRHPHRSHTTLRLDGPRMAGLLPERAGEVAAGTLRAGLGALATFTGSTSRQVRQLIWSADPEAPHQEAKPVRSPDATRDTLRANGKKKSPHPRIAPLAVEEDPAQQDPREALRYRMVRAVLAELPYGDAQCLALHLIAGLNQAEVALALGITHSATRRRIVQGLQLFAQRYEAAAASLGLSMESLAPGATRTSPPLRTTPPPQIAATPPTVAATTTVPLPEAALKSGGPSPFDQPPAIEWDRLFEVTPRTTGAPVETGESIPPPLEPVTIDAVAASNIYASDDAGTLVLEEHAVATAPPDEEKTLGIIETTAVVDAMPVAPVAELPLVDTVVLSAPAEEDADDLVALRLAAVEVPVRPPEPVHVEIAPPASAFSVEYVPELDTTETAMSGTSLETETARFVPVLTTASSTLRPARVVPVLTNADAAPVGQEALNALVSGEVISEPKPLATQAAPWTQPAPVVRHVPVLTPSPRPGPAPQPETPPVERIGDEASMMDSADADAPADTCEAARETVVLAAGAPDGAAVEAQ